MNAFGRTIYTAGYSTTAFAKKLGITEGAVRHWRTGHTTPAPHFIPRIARILKMRRKDVVQMFQDISVNSKTTSVKETSLQHSA